jgi:hypothetical protein
MLISEPVSGESIISTAEVPPRPGKRRYGIYDIWGYDSTPTLPSVGLTDYVARTHFPTREGMKVIAVTFQPGFGSEDEPPALDEPEPLVVDMRGVRVFDQFPGMHATDTIDVAFPLSGRISVIASDLSRQELTVGDVFVQTGGPHAWHNDSDEPCTVVFVMISAERTIP